MSWRNIQYTAFEAGGRLYQFTRMPFGITYGVSCFQKIMDEMISEHTLSDTFSYLDDITTCGKTKEEHDVNLNPFMEVAKKLNLTPNFDKSTFSVTSVKILGYYITQGEIKPDPERLQPLKDLPLPHDTKSLKRVIGLFSYYLQWIANFSDKIGPLAHAKTFPMPCEVQDAFMRTLLVL